MLPGISITPNDTGNNLTTTAVLIHYYIKINFDNNIK